MVGPERVGCRSRTNEARRGSGITADLRKSLLRPECTERRLPTAVKDRNGLARPQILKRRTSGIPSIDQRNGAESVVMALPLPATKTASFFDEISKTNISNFPIPAHEDITITPATAKARGSTSAASPVKAPGGLTLNSSLTLS